MDDLISRSAVKEEIESLTMMITGLRSGKSMLQDFMNEYKKSVLRIIDEQPTAYNVDKVVEQLYELGGVDGFDDCAKAYDRAIEDSIKVVKAGGVNE